MSEFKFACPICGQHITADSKDTGSQISCPTCFRKIVVPPAPSSDESKFVVSASEANRPRPPQSTQLEEGAGPPPKTPFVPGFILLFVLVCAAGGILYAWRAKIFSKPSPAPADGNNGKPAGILPDYTGPSLWTMDLSNATFPNGPVSGDLHQKAFALDHATLSGNNLTLRTGRSGPIELGLNIYFFIHRPEELSGLAALVKPSDAKAPRVVMHWEAAQRESKTFHNGYAMKIEFGPVANGALPGKIFLCLPDESKSWVAGTFRAEIHKNGTPKPRRPMPRETQ